MTVNKPHSNSNSIKINFDMLYGLSEEHLIAVPAQSDYKFHHSILNSWNQLRESAQKQGIELAVISSFRGFNAQKKIWNLKATGQRELLDDKELSIPFSRFDLEQKRDRYLLIQAIMRWSALPGLSRHHWGTDLDVIDQIALKHRPNYTVQLIPSEYQRGGIFQKLGEFLTSSLADTDFFRPYSTDRGGVAPEPWHISHRAQSDQYLRQLNSHHYKRWLHEQAANVELSSTINKNITEIFERFILNIDA